MDKFSSELKFAFSDFIKLLKRNKKTVFLSILTIAFLCFLLAVTRPVNYLLQASFRDKGKTKANIQTSLSELLINPASSHDSEAISVMKSRFLLSKVIQSMNIQGKIWKAENSYPQAKNAYDNLLAEWAYWNNWQIPILTDPKAALQLDQIVYEGEIKQIFFLTVEDSHTFSVRSEKGQEMGKGSIGEPFYYQNLIFTVRNPDETPLEEDDVYIALIEPMSNMIQLIQKNLVITVDKDDKSLLKLQYKHRDRHFAKNFLNQLMNAYQGHLEDDHEISSIAQVNYLERRQQDAGEALEVLMDSYVKNVSHDMSVSGFTSLQQEMDFLAANLASNQQKLTEIELETRRLKNINCDECVHYDSYTGRGDPAIINHLLTEIRSLKQASDSLELALQTQPETSSQTTEALLEKNFKNLESINRCSSETDLLIACLHKKGIEPPKLEALNQAGYPLSAWLASYIEKETSWLNSEDPKKKPLLYQDFKRFKEHFFSYLETFRRLLKIQESTLQQKMRTHGSSKPEFGGISLETSKNLYITFVKELNDIEAKGKQHRFVLDQMQDPDFELSSLTALLSDPVSLERIATATQIVINIKDEDNRTQKELDRLAEELELQKIFLQAHIRQMAELLDLQTGSIRDKITAIQNTTLDLTHQQISLFKKHLGDYIGSRINNLSNEKKLLEDHQAALHERMATIPPKWASEQILNQNLVLQQKFLENLAAMVESKNITKNLEMVQSSPLDHAVAPLHPNPPRLVFFSIFGAVLGFLGASAFLFTRTMIRGIPASQDNLRLARFHVSGAISSLHGDEISATAPMLDNDLDTLRRLIARYEQEGPIQKPAKMILIAPGNGPDFSNTLAKLFAKKGQSTLKLQLGFKNETKPDGLLQYLEGKVPLPEIEKLDGFDFIPSGGTSRYREELLRSPRFIQLLEKLKPSYHWIIGVSPVKIPSAEAENLAKLFDGMAVVVTNETLQNLIAFSNTLDPIRKNSLTFVLSSRSSGG